MPPRSQGRLRVRWASCGIDIKNMPDGYITELARTLKEEGIRFAFGVSGGGPSLELITAFERLGVRFFPVAHEAAGAFMAGACSWDGVPRAVAISIKGPGFANMIPGILSNAYEGRPALTISEAFGPNIPPHRAHKRLDHRAAGQSMLKAFGTADGGMDAVRSLLAVARAEAPGPVHLDVWGDAVGAVPEHESKRAVQSGEPNLAGALRRIREAARPAVILGSLAARKLRGIPWGELAVPVVTTAAAKGVLDETHPYAGGVITGEIKELAPEATVLRRADLLVAFGLRNTELVQANPYEAPLVAVDAAGNGAFQAGMNPAELVLASDVAGCAQTFFESLRGKQWGADCIQEARGRVRAELLRGDWMPAHIFDYLNTWKNERRMTLVLDTGIFCTVGETVWQARTPSGFLGSSNGRFMGTSVPTAIGYAIAYPERRVISVAGDGGIRPYLAEMKLAVRERLPILFVLLSDGGYGTFSVSAKAKGFSPRAYEIPDASWRDIVGMMGCPAASVQNLQAFQDVLSAWERTGGPCFVELAFNPERYATMTGKLR